MNHTEQDTYPLTIDCGEKYGKITLNSHEETVNFLTVTLPKITSEFNMMRKQIESLRAQIPTSANAANLNPNAIVFNPRKSNNTVPTKFGQLWDEYRIKCYDENAAFDLQFPKGRYVTGFVGTLTPTKGQLQHLKRDFNWHDFFIDIEENKFWKGRVVIQRRSEDNKYNVRSQGINEYVEG